MKKVLTLVLTAAFALFAFAALADTFDTSSLTAEERSELIQQLRRENFELQKQESNSRDASDCTRNNPLIKSQTVSFSTTAYDSNFTKFEVNGTLTLTDIISGETAENMVLGANMFNKASGDEQQYVIAQFTVSLFSEKDSELMSVRSYDFKTINGSGTVQEDCYVAGLNSSVEMYSGGISDFYIISLVDLSDPSPCLVFNDKIWISLAE